MNDLRKRFVENLEKGKEINLGELVNAYIAQAIFEVDPMDRGDNQAIATLLEAYSKVEFLTYSTRSVGYSQVIVETDEENPTTIATITNEDIDCVEGYRVRVKPV